MLTNRLGGNYRRYPPTTNTSSPVIVMRKFVLANTLNPISLKDTASATKSRSLSAGDFNSFFPSLLMYNIFRMVSAMSILSFADDYLISGGGDPFLICWNWRKAKMTQQLNIKECFGVDDKVKACRSCRFKSYSPYFWSSS